MLDAKLQTERKLRQDLDLKIFQMRKEKLYQILGKDIVEKVRYYSRKYRSYYNKQGKKNTRRAGTTCIEFLGADFLSTPRRTL